MSRVRPEDPDLSSRCRPVRAEDLDRTVQQIGRDLGSAAPPDASGSPVELPPDLLIELLGPWCSSN